MVRVAILMSAYNGEIYLKEQINSILSQEGNFCLDLYVRDDGSSDKTREILEEYKNKGELDWYTGDNLKPAKSFMNLLNKYKNYDYYAFADQDDYWKKDKIQRGIDKLSGQHGPALYCSNAELVDKDLKRLGRMVYKKSPKTDFETLVCAGGLLGCTMIFNNKLAEKFNNNSKFPQMVLHDFYLAVLCAAIGGNIIYDAYATVEYRQHGNNVIGVSYGVIGTVIGRIRDILYREPVSIAEQASGLLENYSADIPYEKQEWLIKVANYKKRIISRIHLACSQRTKYINRNMGIKIRMSILLGNR